MNQQSLSPNLLKKIKPLVAINSNIRSGRACFKGTRIPVAHVIKHFSLGWNNREIQKLFPEVKLSHINKVISLISEEIKYK